MDRLQELQAFLTIIEAGSMAAAARKLRCSPPAIRRLLSGLEHRVGTRLIERSTHHLVTTEAGIRLAIQARRILADYEEAIQEVSSEQPRGRLRVTAPLIFGRRHFTPIVTSFLRKYPDVQVDVTLTDNNINMIDEGIDLALRIGPLSDSGLVARRVGEVKLVVVGSPGYLCQRGTPAEPKDLVNHDLILLTAVDVVPEWRFRVDGHEQIIRFVPRLQMNDISAILKAVRDGHGLARVLTYQVLPDTESGRLKRVLTGHEPPAWPVHLVMPSARHIAPKARAFLNHALEQLGELDVIRPE
jgi:DNA-binding transcriptional LysR family regulator